MKSEKEHFEGKSTHSYSDYEIDEQCMTHL